MKFSVPVSIAMAALVTLSSGCAAFKKPAQKITADDAKVTAIDNSSADKTKDSDSSKRRGKGKKNRNKGQRPAANGQQTAVTAVSPEVLEGEWTFQTVGGDKLTGDERPYLYFENATGRFYGSNTCNVLNGSFKAGTDGSISFTDIISTLRFCDNAPYETAITKALDSATAYRIENEGTDSQLALLDDDGKTLLTLNRHNTDFLNGAWKVVKIEGTELTNDNMRFVIDIPEHKLHGNAGCNIMNGSIFVDPDKANSIQFQNIITTRMMCPDIKQETALLVALEEVVSGYRYGDSGVALCNNAGKTLVILERIDPADLGTEE